MTPSKALFTETVRARAQGVESACPFCLAQTRRTRPEGPELIFLSGSEAGQRAWLVDEPWVDGRGGFLVWMEHLPPRHHRIVTLGIDDVVAPRELGPPAWMPPLSIEDNYALHAALIETVARLGTPGAETPLVPLIGHCWHRRLPLSAADIWPALFAHGAPLHAREEVADRFEFGVSLLVSTNGRRPNARRRMAAFANGRYLTSRQRAMWLSLFGYA